MLATTIHGPGDIRWEQVPDPSLQAPSDVIVRVVVGCLCGSDLWRYRGFVRLPAGTTMGHECIGEVVEVGAAVERVAIGDIVIVPFVHGCGACPNCLAGMPSACTTSAFTTTGQAEFARVAHADAALTRIGTAAEPPDPASLPSLLALTDVMATGWHAAVSAGVEPGATAVVVGDGAVGLCAVIAASVLGAGRVVALSRNPARQALAEAFGATDILPERGDAAIDRVRELTGGIGADAVLECVGTTESFETAFAIARPASRVGFVGVPADVDAFPIRRAFEGNIGLAGGMAPVQAYLPTLLELVRSGRIDPGRVFDLELPMSDAAAGYVEMDERRAVKVLLRP